MQFTIIKNVHMTSAALTGALFVLRGIWMVNNSERYRQRWAKIVPPIIDSVLLMTGIYMIMETHQYPLTDSWLTAKLSAVLLYIGLGIAGFRAKTKHLRTLFWLLACLVFVYIVLVALTRDPVPFGLFNGSEN